MKAQRGGSLSEQFSEFVDTYSDDLISLQQGRNAMLTHPLRKAGLQRYEISVDSKNLPH